MCIRFDFSINIQNGWKKVDARKILYMSLVYILRANNQKPYACLI